MRQFAGCDMPPHVCGEVSFCLLTPRDSSMKIRKGSDCMDADGSTDIRTKHRWITGEFEPTLDSLCLARPRRVVVGMSYFRTQTSAR